MSGTKKIKKGDYKDKSRLINFSSHLDGNIYAYYCRILDEYYENFLHKNSLKDNILAFRKLQKFDSEGKKYSLCNIHFANSAFNYIKSNVARLLNVYNSVNDKRTVAAIQQTTKEDILQSFPNGDETITQAVESLMNVQLSSLQAEKILEDYLKEK